VPVVELLVDDLHAAPAERLGHHAGAPAQVELVAGAAVEVDAAEASEGVQRGGDEVDRVVGPPPLPDVRPQARGLGLEGELEVGG
jgi:hypothetical protein